MNSTTYRYHILPVTAIVAYKKKIINLTRNAHDADCNQVTPETNKHLFVLATRSLRQVLGRERSRSDEREVSCSEYSQKLPNSVCFNAKLA
jgi:hypothetical protein